MCLRMLIRDIPPQQLPAIFKKLTWYISDDLLFSSSNISDVLFVRMVLR